MKKTILTLMSLAIVFIAFSQSEENNVTNQGTITYEEVVKFEIHLDNMTPEMQEMMPTENRSEKVLYFNGDASRYENTKESADAVIEEETEGGAMKIMISEPDNIFYRDLKEGKIIEQEEFMTRVFLIESESSNDEWKLTGNQKMILGYPCQEAIKGLDSSKVVVWFTPAIPVSSGPCEFGNLPGLVLAVETNDGDRTIMAKSIELAEVDEDMLEKPKKGKKVTKEEYLAIVDEKNKEMGAEGGGGKTIIMKISN